MSLRLTVRGPPSPTCPGLLLDTPDEYHLLTRRAVIKRVCFALRQRGLLASDAFRVMDRTSRGALSLAELAAGVAWLGVKLSQQQLADAFRALDSDQSGSVTLAKFKAVFTPEAIGRIDGAAVADLAQFQPIEELMAAAEAETAARDPAKPLTQRDVQAFRAKPKAVAVLDRVWTSMGMASREQASLWAPQIETSLLRRNRARVCVGFYPAVGFDAPTAAGGAASLLLGKRRVTPLLIELKDEGANGIMGSANLTAVVAAALPHPARFQLAWSLVRAPVPPPAHCK